MRSIRVSSRQMAALGAAFALALQAYAQTPTKMKPGVEPERKASGIFFKFAEALKAKGPAKTTGILNGEPVFKNLKGEYFSVDPATGNLKFHSPESLGFIKLGGADLKGARKGHFIKFEGLKGEAKVTLVGVDAQGRVIQENTRGEKFYLNPQGDMVFVK